MTRIQASKINGYDIRDLPPEDAHNTYWYGAFDEQGELVAKAGNYQPAMALTELVNKVYKIH